MLPLKDSCLIRTQFARTFDNFFLTPQSAFTIGIYRFYLLPFV
jgi:hypothetical protein